MKIPADIRVFRELNGSLVELTPKRDGYLGSSHVSDSSDDFVIELAPRDGLCFAFKAELTDRPPGRHGPSIAVLKSKFSGGKSVYRKGVAATPSQNNNGLPTTKWPKNHIKLVRVSGLEIQLWEVGIATQIDQNNQTSNFFLTSQLVYKGKLFRNHLGTIVVPDWPKSNQWPALFEHLDFFFKGKKLPTIDEPSNNSTPNRRVLKAKGNIGTVLWYNLAYQIGAISMGDTNLRVHWSGIDSKDRFKVLREGQRVRVKETRPALNTFASPRMTQFKEDALGVSAVSAKN